jgi:hypothetical protein
MLYGLALIFLGILAVPSVLLSRQPNARQMLDKVAPYQGWIGVVFCVWGIWALISAVLNVALLSVMPIWWLTWLATGGVTAALGFILGYPVITSLMGSNAQAKAKATQLLIKLAPLQGRLGLVAIGLGIWGVVAALLFVH